MELHVQIRQPCSFLLTAYGACHARDRQMLLKGSHLQSLEQVHIHLVCCQGISQLVPHL